MTEIFNLDESSWSVKGTLDPLTPDTYPDGRLVPKIRVIDPGLGDRKSGGYMYLLLHGVIEDSETVINPKGRAFGAFPLGVGQSTENPEDLFKEILTLNIVTRRTAGFNEKLVYYNTTPLNLLTPWKKVLAYGSIFTANQVCNNTSSIPIDIPQKFRPVYLTVTKLSDDGYYQIPKMIQDFKSSNSVAFNILVHLSMGTILLDSSKGSRVGNPAENLITFMIHIGNFKRKNNKAYSPEYCKRKIMRLGLIFSLGAIGGTSLHIRCTGKMSKRLQAYLGFKRTLCYPLMYVNEGLNKTLWRNECKIEKVQAVLQPSVPNEFKIYDDIIIDNTNGLFKVK
ncbi:matrix protein [Feline morbillivirus type 2]|nr:matrix protein [Feline morbillivirus type 2]QLM03053.1 matrix protein [Feline morbillivirus]